MGKRNKKGPKKYKPGYRKTRKKIGNVVLSLQQQLQKQIDAIQKLEL